MHPVANEVLVSTERIQELMRPYAIPGFTGRVRISVRVRQEAALDVDFGPVEAVESQGVGKPVQRIPDVFRKTIEPTEREMKLAQKLNENQYRFRLGMKIAGIVGHFIDGNLNRFDLEMIG